MTNEVYFGALPENGLLVELPVKLSQRLMDKSCPIFALLGQYLKPFESCVGINGRCYVKTPDGDHLRTVLIADVLKKSENMSFSEIESLCQDMERRLK